MKCADGSEVRLGDRVELWPGNPGTVVFSIDTDEYSDAYPREQRDYLGSGVMVLSEKAGLIHYEQPEPSMRLLARDTADK
jgi:hypothetical protein